MLIAVVVLAWLLASTWATLIIIGVDEGYRGNEWAGVIMACFLSPLSVFAIRPVNRVIKRIMKRR